MDVLLAALGFVLGIWIPHALVAWDERRLGGVQRRRAWNSASHWAAVVGFSFLCVPVHFARTRRSLRGCAFGLLLALVGLALTAGLLEVVALALSV
jgi:hypothetical protein